jgi:hypothetical protein
LKALKAILNLLPIRHLIIKILKVNTCYGVKYFLTLYLFTFMKSFIVILPVLLLLACQPEKSGSALQFSVSLADSLGKSPLDGRLILCITPDSSTEPRNQVSDEFRTAQIFGIEVEGWTSGQTRLLSDTVLGYPVSSLSQLPAGTYYVQAVFHRYETFKRADGHTVKLPMDDWEGQHWNTSPGNLYHKPVKLVIDPSKPASFSLTLDKVIPPIPKPTDSKYVKYVRIKSERLSKFWGRPMELGAFVLLPEGFDEHPQARYPLCIFHGHFPSEFSGFSPNPPPTDMDTSDYIPRFGIHGYKKIQAQEAYQFYKTWTGKNFPRFLVIEIQHACPYYDDSYAVNSANIGPYGDAITYELIPYIEKQFRGIGQGWARYLYGGSTGGWEALAVQVFYPEEYGGCFAACPDPIDFRQYTNFDIYSEKNAYYQEGPFRKTPRPSRRDYLGRISSLVEDANRKELVLGTASRSGDQWDIWEAVYSPVASNGYPERIFDKKTGVINPTVAAYWKENYDLRYILERDWPKLGKKLEGKIHIYCGDMDNYYLNNAVYLMEKFLNSTQKPHYGGEVKYGDRFEHCWNGDPNVPNYLSRLRYNTMYVPKTLKIIEKNAPAGADLKSWRY